MHRDVARVITPARVGVQVTNEGDGYDRVTKPGEFDPKRMQGAASFTFMHNHTGTHLDTFSHIYRENSVYNNAPPPSPGGTVHGDAASVKSIVGRGVLLDVAKYKGQDPLPSDYWISLEISRTRRKRKRWRSKKAILCSCARAGGRCGMSRVPTDAWIWRTVNGTSRSLGLGRTAWPSSMRWTLWPSARITPR